MQSRLSSGVATPCLLLFVLLAASSLFSCTSENSNGDLGMSGDTVSIDFADQSTTHDLVTPKDRIAPNDIVLDGSPDLDAPDAADDQFGQGDQSDLNAPEVKPGPVYQTMRGILHVHSVFSHDACDGNPRPNGQPNAECLQKLRQAACSVGFDFVALTDHPTHVRDFTQQEVLLFDANKGDELVIHNGRAIANRISCANGHKVLISSGFESTHTMPLGLHQKPIDQGLYGGIDNSKPLADVQKQIQGLKDAGGVVSLAHSEDDDISASLIVDGGFESMEWYNPHGNFQALLGGDKLTADIKNIPQLTVLVQRLLKLDEFLLGSSGSAHPDLAYLLLLENLPLKGFTKWQAVTGLRPITGVLGSDVHQNISVELSACKGTGGQIACTLAMQGVESGLGFSIPKSVKDLLLSGGAVILRDGQRFDGYARVMRWLENRVLVPKFGQLELQEALRKGRSYGVFTVFGDPEGFSFYAETATKPISIGDESSGPLTLRIQVPTQPTAMGGAPFSDNEGLSAQITLKILHTDQSGTSTIRQTTNLGELVSETVSAPGAYHIELWIKPRHLLTQLGGLTALADKEFIWLIANPIRIVP